MKRNVWILVCTLVLSHVALMADACDPGEQSYETISKSGPVDMRFDAGPHWIDFSAPVQRVEIESSFGVVFAAECADNTDCLWGLDHNGELLGDNDETVEDGTIGCVVKDGQDDYDTYYEVSDVCMDTDVNALDTDNASSPGSMECQSVLNYCQTMTPERTPSAVQKDNDRLTLSATETDGTVSTLRYFKYYEYYTYDW